MFGLELKIRDISEIPGHKSILVILTIQGHFCKFQFLIVLPG